MSRIKEQFDPVEMLIDAKHKLAAGRFFLALDLSGQIEHHLNEIPPTLETERLRHELRPVMREAWRQTAEAVEEILPRRKLSNL